ncbi:MAG: hypothetical protein NC818_07665, partial [Candidatus Omnitrophica bacterium]|nr:hypothetical protein [Candidatus Omnitrophota bacterium]
TLALGSPLVLILELNASVEFKEPLMVKMSLRGEQFQKDFKEKIPHLDKGRNKVSFELLKELKPDKYHLLVEITNPEYKISLREEKNFVVKENLER